MADYSGYLIALGGTDYPTKYTGLLTAAQGVATEVENGREGQANLAANFARHIKNAVGLFADFPMNGYRCTGAPMPVAGGDLVNKTYADNLAFSAALPAQTGNTGKVIRTDGAVATWQDWWGPVTSLTGAGTLAMRTAYHVDTSASPGGFSVNMPAGVAGGWFLIRDKGLSLEANPLTLVPNGGDFVYGVAQSYIMDTDGESLAFIFDSTKGWIRA